MRFTPLDMASYPRREVFKYFSKMAPTGYSLTVNADVTKLIRTLKEQGIKFFPVYLYKELLPLSLTSHHAATDGYHISRFLEELQGDMDSFSV